MKMAETVARVHTHTHTSSSSRLKNNIKSCTLFKNGVTVFGLPKIINKKDSFKICA
jgi:hypothetical protein